MASLTKKATFTTELNADSTEWCPINEYCDLFVCGTYQLSKDEDQKPIDYKIKPEIRLGRLYLFQLCNETSVSLKLLQNLPMPGILDCKWCHFKLDDKIYLALVNASGELRLLELLENDNGINLKEINKIKLTSDEETLLLSLDWSTGITSSNVKIVVSSSSGSVTVVSLHDGCLIVQNTWNMHSFEAWIASFNYWNNNVFFSGGDDCYLKCFDDRIGHVVHTTNAHGAGVTSLHMNTKKEYALISGSYDESVFFWDIRSMKQPRNTLNIGGGIWRLKWEPRTCDKICASCMYYGSVVIDGVNESIIAEYKEHTSINYGIDWSLLSEERICHAFNVDRNDNNVYNVITVCSFYDNLLSLALLESPKKN